MAKNNTSATPSSEELLDKIKTEIASVESSLETKNAELKEVEESLDTKKSELAELENSIESKKAELTAIEESLENKNTQFLEAPEEAIQEFEFEGKKYSFSPDAPQVINFGGQKFTRKEITENEEILLQLIGGNSSLIKKI